MSMALSELTKEAIQLSSHQRLVLAGFLLELDSSTEISSVDSDWDREILARIEAIDNGTAIGISYGDVMKAADELLAK
jgi:hypothetical protein